VRRFRSVLAAAVLYLAAWPAQATFHLWSFAEAFSTADGRIQFVEMVALTGGQQFVSGHTLVASGGGTAARAVTMDRNLPEDTTGRRMLFATAAFAAATGITPDFTLPEGFLATGGGTLTFGEGADTWTYAALPSDGRLSLSRDGSTATNSPTNFSGAIGSYVPEAPAADFNVQGLWWRSPAGSESGWGLNTVQQGTTLFVTWFTFGADGNGMWLVMSDARRSAANAYAGTIYRVRGPAFNAVPFDPSQVVATPVGSGTLTFADANNGTFAYNVDGVTQSKPITRIVFATPVSTCSQP
jgi:hypothetical protein